MSQADNDPFGIGIMNSAAPALPPASLPQYASYGTPSVARPAAVKKKQSFGKSGKFWALVGSGTGAAFVVVFIVIGLIGHLARTVRRAGLIGVGSEKVEWITHTSPLDGYSVEIVKQAPGVVIPELAGKVGPGGVVSATSRQGPCTIVNCERLPLALSDAQAAIALSAWESVVSTEITRQRGQITSSAPCVIGGIPGRQIVIEAPEGLTTSVVQFQAVFQNNRAYILGFLATQPNFRQAEADRFFNSFRFLGSETGTAAKKSQPLNVDYAEARKNFRTKLTRQIPAPQPPVALEPLVPPPGTTLVEYRSQQLTLRAVASAPRNDGVKRPGLLYLHGGFAYGAEDWDQARPFVDAGYVVMIPALRGENGQPGSFTMFYDEVDDVLAAAEALAQHPDVDPRNLFVAGHSAGGILAALAAMTTDRFRACAPFSGVLDMRLANGDPTFPSVFNSGDDQEWQMRSAVDFAFSFKCPTRLFYGDQELGYDTFINETARRAKEHGLDVEATRVPGDHMSMLDAAIPQTIAFFAQHQAP